jgi:hypothetical protein
VDEIVFDVIGRESAVVDGLEIKDSEESEDLLAEHQALLQIKKEPSNNEPNENYHDDAPLFDAPLFVAPSPKPFTIRQSPSPSRSLKRGPSVMSLDSSGSGIDEEIKRTKLSLLQSQLRGQDL